MKFKFYLSSLVFMLASFMMVNAQTKTVKGKITDGVEALYGVNVIIQGTTTGVITDDDGNFVISSENDLPWTLEISSLGFEGQTYLVKSENQVIELSLSSGESLDEVVISGSRKASEIKDIIEKHYLWLIQVDFEKKENISNFWYYSKNKQEPRLSNRFEEDGSENELPLAIARDIKKLYQEICTVDPESTLAEFLLSQKNLRYVVRIVLS